MDSPPTELEQILVERIGRQGPITFRDFMQAALYDKRLGYYNTERLKIGAQGDYYTASNVHPAFGAVLARAFVELWQATPLARSRQPLTVIEIGAGTGHLASDVLFAIRDEHPQAFEDLSYVIIEQSPAMRAGQRERLAPFAGRARWQLIQDIAPATAIAFSNELIDAMPVHRARVNRGRIQEQFVTAGQGSGDGHVNRLSLIWAEPSTERLLSYIERMNIRLAEGQVVEINLDAVDWLAEVARAISEGYLVTVDYGDQSSHLYGPDRIHGTLRSFYQHRLIDSPLERVGEQDITSSVNFTALIEYGRDYGFEAISYERQSAFLIRNGLIERIAAMHDTNETVDDMKERLAIKNLFVPGGISDNFRVLVQKRSSVRGQGSGAGGQG
jgi:SAM-dependent MidA family methyltransferase